MTNRQCWGSVTFWFRSGFWSPDPYLWLMDPDPTQDPTPFFSDFKDENKFTFSSYNLPTGTISSLLKIIFLLKFCVKILFCRHNFSFLNIFIWKGKDSELDPEPEPDPYLWLMDLRGPKNMGILRIQIPNTANRWTKLITNHLYLSFDVDLVRTLLAEYEYGQFHEIRSWYVHLPHKQLRIHS